MFSWNWSSKKVNSTPVISLTPVNKVYDENSSTPSHQVEPSVNKSIDNTSHIFLEYSPKNLLFLSKESQTEPSSCQKCLDLGSKLQEQNLSALELATLQNQFTILQHEFEIQCKELKKISEVTQSLPFENQPLSSRIQEYIQNTEQLIEKLYNDLDNCYSKIYVLESDIEQLKEYLDDEKKVSSHFNNQLTLIQCHKDIQENCIQDLQSDNGILRLDLKQCNEDYNSLFDSYDQLSQKFSELCQSVQEEREELEEVHRQIASKIFAKLLHPPEDTKLVQKENKKLMKKNTRLREVIDEWKKKDQLLKIREKEIEKESRELEYKQIQYELEKSVEMEELQKIKESSKLVYDKLMEEEKCMQPMFVLQKENQELKQKIYELENKIKLYNNQNIISFNRALRSHVPVPFQPIHTSHYLN
jgi:chromosome segregation ATPase